MKSMPSGRTVAVAVLSLTVLTAPAWGQAAPQARNFDARIQANAGISHAPSTTQLQGVGRLQQEIPGLLVRYEPTTGATQALTSPVGYLTAAAPGQDHREIALGFVQQHLDALGLEASDVAGLVATDVVPSRTSGATHFYFQQTLAGIPIYNGQLQVHVARDGQVLGVNNGFLPGLAGAVNTLRADQGADQAVAAAAANLGIDLAGAPAVLARRDGARQTSVVDGSGISQDDITAQLVLVPINRGTARLAWNFQIQTLDGLHWYDLTVDAVSGKVWTRFDWTNSGTYRVYEQPVESPNHTTPLPPADARTLASNPENATASPNGWFTGGTMAGNNVHACPDTNGNNVCDSDPQCAGTTCDFPIDLTQAPSTYIPAATANLFYWNNIIHDVQYQYGFDEVGGNFQENNFGKGGAGSDSVNADAQDGSGTCNANFSTPTDGGNPRMQMFICGNATPARDGDLDSGVIVHEYGHGISIRQVGGPSNSSCLNNTQQPGEGWSDWHALVYTAEAGDLGTDARGVGSYLFDLPPDGGTIRDLPYSTDPAINNWTYESIAGASVPHGVGSRWAQAIWEVYWALVDQYGFDPDLYNATGGAGNQRALQYINEGFKNTACSPTFLDTRDGIIQAATTLNGGVDVCLLWDAFAAFGLGTDATTGGSNSQTATNGFSVPLECQCSPAPIADAGPDQTICLGDSTVVGTPAQPDNTYLWSPGGETTAQITVSPTVTTTYTVTATTTCGSKNDSATVFVDDGSTPPGLSDDFEGDVSGWTTSGLWHLAVNTGCATPGYSSPVSSFYYGQEATCTYDTGAANSGSLTSPAISGITAASTLTFDYFRQVESFNGDFDRTRVEIVTSTGATTVWSRNSSNPSENAWVPSGPIDLSAFAGQQIQVRFVFETGDGVSNNFTGWLVDDVVVTGESPCTQPPPPCTTDADCDDGAFCNGAETCDIASGICQPGTPVDCNDGVGCTVDACNETTDACDNTPDDAACDNGLFCDGAETCDAVLDCQPGSNPCQAGDTCDEAADVCVPPPTTISLTATGFKVKGVHTVDLAWSGATSTNVDIFRNGALIITTANDGAHTDSTGNKGGNATYVYQVCEAGTSVCSNTATVNF